MTAASAAVIAAFENVTEDDLRAAAAGHVAEDVAYARALDVAAEAPTGRDLTGPCSYDRDCAALGVLTVEREALEFRGEVTWVHACPPCHHVMATTV